ncbi:MAG: outer membrane protein transport protein [Hyphomicrobiales bacterium]
MATAPVRRPLAAPASPISTDATSQAVNPAGLAHVGSQVNAAFSLFSPDRKFTGGTVPGFTTTGKVDSSNDIFAVPRLRHFLCPRRSVGDRFMMIGNGGMNTTYKNAAGGLIPPPNGCGGAPNFGPFCAGKAGVDLNQMIMGVTYARDMGAVSVGVTPMFAVQRFSARGLGAFAGVSNNAASLTSGENSYSYGVGVRAGIELEVTPRMRVGLAGQTPIWMTEFDKYKGLFADGGDFDIPGNVTVGVAYDVTDTVTVMADWKHIFYNSVGAVGNPMGNLAACMGGNAASCLGGSNGAGFGWKDVDAFKFGVEWNATDALTVRAGYSYNTQPVKSADVMFNILAPGVIQHHITAGLKYDFNEQHSIELAAAYMPVAKVSGGEMAGFGNPAHRIDLEMSQIDVTLGYVYRFGAPKAAAEPIVRKY